MKKITWEKAKQEIKKGVIFLEFSTKWCGDCKVMKPIIQRAEEIISKQRQDVKFIEVDAEETNLFRNNDEFNVLKVPSFYKIVDGQKTHIGSEYLPVEKLVKFFI